MSKNIPVIKYLLNNNFTCNMNNDFKEKHFLFKPADHELSFNSIVFPNSQLGNLKLFLVCNMVIKYHINPKKQKYSFEELWFHSPIWNDFLRLRKKYPQDIPIKEWITELNYPINEIHDLYNLIQTLNICCPLKILKHYKYQNLYTDIREIQLKTEMSKDIILYALQAFKFI